MAKKKVLIIEDERPIAKALELKLGNAGFEVEVLFNGEDAIKSIKKDKFDIILLDLVLPKIDGFGVLAEIKGEMKISTPVIVLSNLSQEDDVKRVKGLGADEYFIKSNTPIADIVDLVNKFFN